MRMTQNLSHLLFPAELANLRIMSPSTQHCNADERKYLSLCKLKLPPNHVDKVGSKTFHHSGEERSLDHHNIIKGCMQLSLSITMIINMECRVF